MPLIEILGPTPVSSGAASFQFTDVTTLSNGNYALTWIERNPLNGATRLHTTVYGSDGQPIPGAVNRIVTAPDSNIYAQNVVALQDGEYAIAWVTQLSTGTGTLEVYTVVYDATGQQKAGVSVAAVTTTTTSEQDPQLTLLSNGNYAITWRTDSGGSGTGALYEIYTAVYSPNAQPASATGVVNVTSTGTLREMSPTVVALADGRYALAWVGGPPTAGAPWTVYTAVMDETGAPLAGASTLAIDATVSGSADPQIAALSDGSYALAWWADDGVWTAVLGPDGQVKPGTSVTQVDTVGQQPEVVALAGGGYGITWVRSNSQIEVAVYSENAVLQDGSSLALPQLIGSRPEMVALSTGGFAIAWYGSGSDAEIFTAAFDAAGQSVNTPPIEQVTATPTLMDAVLSMTALENGRYALVWYETSASTLPVVHTAVYQVLVAPEITSPASFTIAENATLPFADVDAIPGNPGDTLTYSIALPGGENGAGADGALFQIDAASGQLSFITAPNFEAPADAGGDNVYDVTVQVSDGNGGIDTQTISVTVTDVVNEAPVTADANVAMSEDTARVLTLADFAFSDPGESTAPDTLRHIVIQSLPHEGILTLDGVAVTTAQVHSGLVLTPADIAAGRLAYTPPANANGLDFASIQFQVRDSGGPGDEANVTGHWAFNASGADDSAGNNHLQLTGNATYGNGLFDFGLVLDGAKASGATLADPSLYGFGSGDFTVQLWAKLDTLDREAVLIEKFDNDSGPGWTFTIAGGTGLQFYAAPAGFVNIPNVPVSLDTWHQFTVTRSGDTFRIFMDGVEMGSGSGGGAMPTSAAPLLIGGRGAGDARNFTVDGTIDNVVILDRALSGAEVTAGWNGGVGVDPGSNTSEGGVLHMDIAPVNDAPSFGAPGDGIVTTAIGGPTATPYAVALESDGKIVVAGTAGSSHDRFAIVRYNSDGSLDSTFDSDGKIITAIGSSISDSGRSVALQPDGKILVAGYSSSSTLEFALVRYNGDGSLDSTFNGNGWVTTGVGNSGSSGYSVALQPDGKIVVAGGADTGFALVRYNADGSLDTSFDNDGIVTTAVGNAQSAGVSTALQPDGKILVAGDAIGADNDFALVRYNVDGSLDASFGTNGQVITAVGSGNDNVRGVALQSDGKILVVGRSSSGLALVRYNADGSLDATFSEDGVVTTNLATNTDGHSVAMQADGKILIAGHTGISRSDFAVVRYNSDGSLDSSFGFGGAVITAVSDRDDIGRSVTVQSDGKILVTGNNGLFALVRYNPDGSLDTTFDSQSSLNNTAAFTEDGPAVVLDSTVVISDIDLAQAGSYAGATLTLQRQGGANPDDVFGGSGALVIGIAPSGVSGPGALYLSGVYIGVLSEVQTTGRLAVVFSAATTEAQINAALSAITYANTSDNPPPSVTIEWIFSDGNTGVQGPGGALTATGTTSVTITSANDDPVIISNLGGLTAQVSVTENTAAVTTVAATDPDLPAQTLTYAITGGADAALFQIDAVSGALSFITAPNYEAPADAGGDNAYDVVVEVSDGNGGADTQAIEVTVTNIQENRAPVVHGPAHLDIVTVNYYSNNVAVLYGDGTGSFAGSTHGLAGGVGPASAAIGDFNEDGRNDIVVANALGPNVSVLLAGPGVGFTASTVGVGGPRPVFVEAADINGDSFLDIVTANGSTGSTVSILYGNGTGSFAPAVLVSSGGSTPVALAVGDLDGDNDIDIVTANGASNTVGILRNNGFGGFSVSSAGMGGGTNPFSIALGDFNRDGRLDIVTANQGTSQISVLTADGAGGFTASTVGTGSGDTYSVAVGDLNGDGAADIVTANRASSNVSILINNGLGGFTASTTSIGAAINPWVASLGDFDGDGDLDIATANQGSDSVSILLNSGSGTFTVGGVVPTGGDNPVPLAIGDVDNAQLVVEDGTLVFHATSRNRITISDVDASTGDVTAEISVAAGTLALGTATGVTAAGNNTATVTITGAIAAINAALDGLTYRPNPDFNGTDSLVVTVNDNDNTSPEGPRSTTSVASILVAPVNDAPVITITSAPESLIEAGAGGPGVATATADLLKSDIDGGPILHYDITYLHSQGWAQTGPSQLQRGFAYGTAVFDYDFNGGDAATLTYQLDNAIVDSLAAGQSVSDTVTVSASDGLLRSDRGVTFTIEGRNDAPVAGNDNLTALQLASRAYSFNPANGHWYRVEQGSQTGALTFTQADAIAGSYGGYLATITNGQENAFVHGLIQGIQPNGSISDPFATRGAWIGGSDAAVEGTWRWITGPEAGQTFWTAPGTTQIFASWNPIEPNNVGNEDFVFMGNNGNWFDYNGTSAVAGYVVENEIGRAGDGSYTTEDAARTVDVATLLANDGDVDSGAAISMTGFSATSARGATITRVGDTITYDPTGAAQIQALNVGGHLIDTFTYTITDEHGAASTATVELAVSGINDAPVITIASAPANLIEAGVAGPGVASANATLVKSDIDGGPILHYDITYLHSQGWAQTGPSQLQRGFAYGTAVFDYDFNGGDTATLTYQLDNAIADSLAVGQSVADTVTIFVHDGLLRSDRDVTFTIEGRNDAPIAGNDRLDGWAQLQASNFLYNPANGHWYRFDGITSNFATAANLAAAAAPGAYLATITSAEENAYITAALQPLLTSIPPDLSIPNPDARFSYWFGGSDAGQEGQWAWLGGPEAGQLFWNNGPTGAYTIWAPINPNNGAGLEHHVMISASGGVWHDYWGDQPARGFVIEVGGRPEDAAFTTEDAVRTIDASTLLANDTDVDSGAVISITSVGALSANGAAITLSGGQITYDPTAALSLQALAIGQFAIDSFTYTVTDEHGATSTATVELAVTGLNDAPVAVSDDLGTLANEDTPASFAGSLLLANDTDVDNGAVLAVTAVSATTSLGASLSLSGGTITYDPAPVLAFQSLGVGQSATDSFTYTITDEHGATSTATAVIGIAGLNDAPMITSDGGEETTAILIAENSTDVTFVTADDIDIGDVLSYTIVGGADAARFVIDSATGDLRFALAPDFEAPADVGGDNFYEVVVAANDEHGGSDTQTITVEIANLAGISPAASNAQTQVGTGEEDVLTGLNGANTLRGLGGNDTLVGGGGADRLEGGAGNDSLVGGAGNDIMLGGTGSDSYLVEQAGDVVTEGANEGIDTVRTTLASYTLTANVENLAFTGTAAFTGTGNALDNTIVSGNGADTLDGGAGSDTLTGGSGNDTYVVDTLGDVVIEAAAGGTDTIRTTLASYALTSLANVESLTFAGLGSFNGIGDGAANTLTGSAGADTLDGGAGTDRLVGLAGDDTYLVDLSTDVIVEAAGGGIDGVLATSASYTLSANIETLTYVGAGTFAGTGNGSNNTLVGGAGADTLDGSGGNDRIDGQAGNDSLLGGQGDDAFIVAIGDGNDFVNGGGGIDTYDASTTSASAVINLVTGLAIGADIGSDTLLAMENVIAGSGADVITSGTTRNILTGGGGADTFVFTSLAAAGTGTQRDQITDFTIGADLIDLSAIDANGTLAGDPAFIFAGEITTVANGLGQLARGTVGYRFETDVNGIEHTIVEANTNANLAADFQIDLIGRRVLSAADLIL